MREKDSTTDQRNFTRMDIDAPADLVTMTSEPQRIQGVCRDLSAGGMLLETKQMLPPGTNLQVTLRSHYADQPMLSCQGRVVRSDSAAEDRVIVGLEILEFLD